MGKHKLTERMIRNTRPDSGKRKVTLYDEDVPGLLAEIRATGTGTFFVRYNDAYGQKRYVKIGNVGALTIKDAREAARKMLARVACGEDPATQRDIRRTIPTFEQFAWDRYLPHIKTYKRSWQSDFYQLRNHLVPALAKKPLDAIQRSDLYALIQNHHRNHAPASTNRLLAGLRDVFAKAVEWEVIDTNPATGIKPYPVYNERCRTLTENEAHQLMDSLSQSKNKNLSSIIAFLILTGARRGEAMRARWEDFDFTRGIWRIPETKAGGAREVPINNELHLLLTQLQSDRSADWVFTNPHTGRPYKNIFNAWDSARQRAGLGDVHIHDLRHSFASFLINNGRSLYEVKELLGHRSIKTTQRYAHLQHSTLRDASNSLGIQLQERH